MDAHDMVELFVDVAAAVRQAIAGLADWGPSGRRPGQYKIDVSADQIAVDRLSAAGFAVLSEESGITGAGRPILVVVDPIDGSTNAAAGLPWYATSLCAVDAHGPVAAAVINQATDTHWHAIRNEGAWRDGELMSPAGTERLSDAFVAVSGLPERHMGWRQFRCYGAAALDICAVADGTFDAFIDLSVDAHGSWDYLGALLVLREAGGVIVDRHDRELVMGDHRSRRTPVAAATPGLLAEILAELDTRG